MQHPCEEGRIGRHIIKTSSCRLLRVRDWRGGLTGGAQDPAFFPQGLRKTCVTMDQERPRSDLSINSRNSLRKVLHLEFLYRENKACAVPRGGCWGTDVGPQSMGLREVGHTCGQGTQPHPAGQGALCRPSRRLLIPGAPSSRGRLFLGRLYSRL